MPVFTAAPEKHIGEQVKSAVRTVHVRSTFRTERTALFHFSYHFSNGVFASTSIPTNPRTRFPPV